MEIVIFEKRVYVARNDSEKAEYDAKYKYMGGVKELQIDNEEKCKEIIHYSAEKERFFHYGKGRYLFFSATLSFKSLFILYKLKSSNLIYIEK